MQSLIACNDQAIAGKLRLCLANLGIECSLDQVLSHESAQIAAENHQGDQSFVIFFGSQQLAADDLASLRRLCAACDDHFKVVVVGTNFSASAILQAVRGGAVDCLNLDRDFDEELRYLMDRIHIASGGRARLGKLFTVVAAVGGAGASVLAMNLAAVIAERQQQCGLLDLHVRGGDLAALLNIDPRHNLLSLAGKTEQLDRTMLDQSLFKHDCGVHLLASGEPFSDWRLIRPELIQKVVQLSRSTYASVVVDLEDCDHVEQIRTLASSDNIILPLRPDFVSLMRTKKLLNFWTSANVSREHIMLVINRVGQPKELPLKLIDEALGIQAQFQIADDPVAINEAINLGIPLVTAFPKSKAARGIVRLAESLLGIASETPQQSYLSRAWLSRLPLNQSFKTAASFFGSVNT